MDKKEMENKASAFIQKGKNFAQTVSDTVTSDETKEKVNKANALLVQKGRFLAQKVVETARSDETKENINKLKSQAQDAFTKSASMSKSAVKVAKDKGEYFASNNTFILHNKVPAAILFVYLVSFFLPSVQVYRSSLSINELFDSSAFILYYIVVAAAIGASLFGAKNAICRCLVALIVGVAVFNVGSYISDAYSLTRELAGNSRVQLDFSDILHFLGVKGLTFGAYIYVLSFLALIPLVFTKYKSRSFPVSAPEAVEVPDIIEQNTLTSGEKANKQEAEDTSTKSTIKAKPAIKIAKDTGTLFLSGDNLDLYNKVPAAILFVYLVSFFLPSVNVFGVSLSINELFDSSAYTLYYFVIVSGIVAILFGAKSTICRFLVALIVGVVVFHLGRHVYDAYSLALEWAGSSAVRLTFDEVFPLLNIKNLSIGAYIYALSFLALVPLIFTQYQSRSVMVTELEPVETSKTVE